MPDKYANLVSEFVSSEDIELMFLTMAGKIRYFIARVGPEISKVKILLRKMYQKMLLEIKTEELEISINQDYEEAQKFLTLYGQTFGDVKEIIKLANIEQKASDLLVQLASSKLTSADEINLIQSFAKA